MPVPRTSPEYRDLSDWVVARVLQAIRDGSIKPGERLVERDVAERFSVSRAPVRDAIHKLEKLEVIERDSSRATHVRSWTNRDAAELLLMLDALVLLAVQMAVGYLSPNDLELLHANLDRAKVAAEAGTPDVAEQMRRDAEFHSIIAEASGNKRLAAHMAGMWSTLEMCDMDFLAMAGRGFDIQFHADLLDVLRRGDANEVGLFARRRQRQCQEAILRALRQPFRATGLDV